VEQYHHAVEAPYGHNKLEYLKESFESHSRFYRAVASFFVTLSFGGGVVVGLFVVQRVTQYVGCFQDVTLESTTAYERHLLTSWFQLHWLTGQTSQ